MRFSRYRLILTTLLSATLLLSSCSPAFPPLGSSSTPAAATINIPTATIPPGLMTADGSRPLTFPADLGAHPNFRTEWWYYTGNLQTTEGRHFGFELTIFRVSLLPPTTSLPNDSKWSDRELYFAHFAISDVADNHFYAFQRYSRSNPGLAGAPANPYHVWLEDWNITQRAPGIYQLQAEQSGVSLDITLKDELGIVLQGINGYSRKGQNPDNASYYYSQPRLRADGFVRLNNIQYRVNGLAWHDHEFSSGELDQNQIGWDWFSFQFEDGYALMLFQLRERDGGISGSSSGTWIASDGTSQPLQKSDFKIDVLGTWQSPHTQGIYPASWKIALAIQDCLLNIHPWMADQEINFPPVTYWEGAVHFDGSCKNLPVRGNGYIELTGYAGNLPLP